MPDLFPSPRTLLITLLSNIHGRVYSSYVIIALVLGTLFWIAPESGNVELTQHSIGRGMWKLLAAAIVLALVRTMIRAFLGNRRIAVRRTWSATSGDR